ncbi:cupin domain-containing protein [Streptomyces sporangiiformans]|uniref:Cupin domain-containing protein n=1 Tax=Streptomyces sporangiiformans TaxID=2315329 RepID=A0A505DIY6_9ACTN|nr:cupin domain-containing protein [Streptomyces sporangiiformans]TPQ17301.1 cupin domain-containing protein [Streptomyces sporangiiformans]
MVRRVVTGISASGKPVVVSDGEPPRTRQYTHTPGFANSLVWSTAAPAAPSADPTAAIRSWVPGPGETIALTVTFPPASVYADPSFNPAAAGAEQLEATPGLAELFEPDAPGMHTTPTVDYGVVLQGEIVLDLDGGEVATLGPGDIVVQNSTRHAWRNPGTEPATVFFVLIGAGGAS